jgi:hypothetical protein
MWEPLRSHWLCGLASKAVDVTEYAWKFRYPGEPEEPPLPEAQAAFVLAREVYEATLSRLPAEGRSPR